MRGQACVHVPNIQCYQPRYVVRNCRGFSQRPLRQIPSLPSLPARYQGVRSRRPESNALRPFDSPSLNEEDAGINPRGGPQPKPPGESVPGRLWRILLRRLSSLPLAIGELAVIAALCALGTIIEQNKSVEYYMENYPNGASKVLGFLDYHVILGTQLDHIYTANYFVGLLLLLAASLAACTYTRQLPMARVAQKWRFPSSAKSVVSMGAKGCAFTLPNADARELGRLLKQSSYQVFFKEGALYAFKGFAGKIGPIFVHASMLLIIAGVTYGSFCGFKGQVMVPEGLEFRLGDRLVPKSPLAIYPPGAYDQLHVNSFEVQYRDDGSVGQFYSDLSVLDSEGNERLRKIISVNDPLRYKGVTAYQADYGMAAVTLKAEGSPLQPPEANCSICRWPRLKTKQMFFLPERGSGQGARILWPTPHAIGLVLARGDERGEGEGVGDLHSCRGTQGGWEQAQGVALVARDFQLVVLYNSDGTFAGVRRVGSGKPIEVEGLKITVESIIGSTGLELKSDPGVPIVYAGFGGLMIATLVSYLSHSQVWALQEGSAVHVSGKSNRAMFDFQAELERILENVPENVRAPPEQLTASSTPQTPSPTESSTPSADSHA